MINGYATETKGEEWKQIPNYESLYEASNFGRIRTASGKVTSSARFPHREWKQRILKQKIYKNKKGRADCRVSLWKNGQEKTWLVSRLIALAWIGTPASDMTVNHINGNQLDNRPENLEWVSLKDNIKKGFEDGLYDSFLKPVVLQGKNNCLIEFKSRSQASRFLGRCDTYVSALIGRGSNIAKSIKGEVYKIIS